MTSKAPSLRQKMMSENLRRSLGEFFLHNVAGGLLVSCASVNISPDLRNAKVYLSVLDLQNPGRTYEISEDIKRDAKRHIAENLKLKTVPQMEYIVQEN